MKDLISYKNIPDEHIAFADGILHIIQGNGEEGDQRCTKIIMLAEFDQPLLLSQIRNRFPDAYLIIWENYLRGDIYRYGNHGVEWERIGDTVGFA